VGLLLPQEATFLLGNGQMDVNQLSFHITDSLLQILNGIPTQLFSNLPNSRVWINSPSWTSSLSRLIS
jgi:hypothetical protein